MRHSLGCKLVPVHDQEYEIGLFASNSAVIPVARKLANDRNIAGGKMLRAFDHPVATSKCCQT